MDFLTGALNTTQAALATQGKHNVKTRSKDDMTKKSKKYKHFADASYRQTGSVKGYTLVPEFSDKETSVYRKGDKFVISSRGTASVSDVASDLSLAKGKEPERVQQFKDLVGRVKKHYGLSKSQLKLTGHSLGGYIAGLAGHELGIESHIFNPASTSLGSSENQKRLKSMVNSEHVHTNIIEGDPVSASLLKHVKTGSQVQVIDAGKNVATSHSMSNFFEDDQQKAGSLYKYGFQLQPRAYRKEKVKAGGSNILDYWYHGQAEPDKSRPMKVKTREGKTVETVGIGAQIYTTQGLLWTYDTEGKVTPLVGTLKDKSALLKKADGYGRGPTVLLNGNNSVSEDQQMVGFSSGIGNSEWQPIRIKHSRDWQELLAGKELTAKELQAFSVNKKSVKFQAAIDPFASLDLYMNAGDKRNRDLKVVGEFVTGALPSILLSGAELIADVFTEGMASVVLESIDSITGLTDKASGILSSYLGDDQRDTHWEDVEDVFGDHTWAVDPFGWQDPDKNIVKDRRVEKQLGNYQKRMEALPAEVQAQLVEDKRYQYDPTDLSSFTRAQEFLSYTELALENREYADQIQVQSTKYGFQNKTKDMGVGKLQESVIPRPGLRSHFGLKAETERQDRWVESITEQHRADLKERDTKTD